MKKIYNTVDNKIKNLRSVLIHYEKEKDYAKCLKIESGIFYLENVLIDINHLMTKGE